MSTDLRTDYQAVAQLPNPIASQRTAAEVARCWLGRWRRSRDHVTCPWCDYPETLLLDWLTEINAVEAERRRRRGRPM